MSGQTVEQTVVTDALMGRHGIKMARTKEEKDMIHKYTIEQAMKGAFYGTLAGVGANIILSRYWGFWSRLHHTPRWIFILAWPCTGFTLLGEHSALDLERKLAARKSRVDIDSLQTATAPVEFEPRGRFSWIPAAEDIKKYVLDNRFKVVGMGWLTVTSLTLATLWANKNMPVAQKVIHARMYAQGTALASFVGFAFAANVPVDRTSDMDKISEKYFRAILDGRDVAGPDTPDAKRPVAYTKHSITDGGVVVRGG